NPDQLRRRERYRPDSSLKGVKIGRRLGVKFARQLTERAFKTATGLTAGSWRGLYWARWSDALAEAGYQPNKFGAKFEIDRVIGSFIEAARHYKRLPTEPELRMFRRLRPDIRHEQTIRSYFGSKEQLLSNLRAWLENNAGYDDIIEMLGPERET